MDLIAPLGVGLDSVNIGFGSCTESDDDDMLEIVSLSPVIFKDKTNQGPLKEGEQHGHTEEYNKKTPRDMTNLHKDNPKQAKNHAGGIGLEEMHVFFSMMLESFGFIEVESGINDYIDGNQNSQHGLVLDQLSPVSVSGKESFGKRTVKSNIVAEAKRKVDDQSVNNNMQSVKYFLIFFDHMFAPWILILSSSRFLSFL